MPIHEPGPHLPFPEGQQPSDLDVFRLFVSDDMLEHFVNATNSYAEKKKEEKRNFYRKFKLVPLMKEEML